MHTDEPTQYKPVRLTGVTELRIHGVSGTPPSSMLDDQHPMQVWGDKTAGFYRRAGHTSDTPPPADNLEAYSWGGLTAGSGTRALWLLLLPFMLVNVAAWAHPPRRGPKDKPVGLMSGALRVLALTLTLTLLLAFAFLSMDLIAWQCADRAADCGSEHWYSSLLLDRAPGVRVALGALPVVAVIVLIRWLSHSTSKKYEEWHPKDEQPADDRADVPHGVWDMSHPNFWYGKGPLARLRSLHVTACWVTLAGLIAYAAGAVDDERDAVATAIAYTAAAVLALIALMLASPVTGRRHELLGGHTPKGWKKAFCWIVPKAPYAAFALLVAAVLYAFTTPDAPQPPGSLPGLHWAKNAVSTGQLAAFGALVAGTVWSLRGIGSRDKTDSTYGLLLHGWGAPLLAAMGVMLAGSFAAGLTLRFADYLGCPEKCDDADNVRFVLPDVYEHTARGFFVAAVVGAIGIAYVWFRVRARLAASALPLVGTEYPPDCADPKRREQIAGIHATAALTDYGARPLAWIALAGAFGATPLLYWLLDALDFLERLPLLNKLDGPIGKAAEDAFTTAGAWAVGFFALGLVGIGHQAYRNEGLRRTVGILWDLGTFWPRAAHPFAPPCYCERTVPEFARRIEQLRDSDPVGRSGVVVSAHSQGTVIAVATLLRLRTEPQRLALLTYGSPLQRLYGRAFPHFFGLPVLDYVRRTYGGRWTNLYRRSDPIGGPVACADADVPQPDGPDRRLSDPIFKTDPYAFDPPPPYGHSHYFADAAFDPCVAALAARVRSG
jgi:heme/copper-type cytochrome/quinol oxidase subunit 3